ncbi:MAG: D-alanyl-D-alanine carboxypeptidase/D-alanyl-D-alanine-endopeptidase [Ignavibacteriaceae bacterium]|nr:D-alanyl-D-alanine carboxypeptidase/D-alanyl-D-alanine-endopeptidase [Ignavibacteriaceae bacterium]
MKKISYSIFFFSFIFTLMGCAGTNEISSDRYASLHTKIDSLLNDPRFGNAHLGVLIKSQSSGKVLYERNAGKLFMPASNEKILTTSGALIKLGTDFKFKTLLTYSGVIQDSLLNGDLIVFGDGDPTLYSRFYKTPDEVFHRWAKLLKQNGVKKISGNIIGDDNAFDDEPIGYGWSHDGLDSWYSAEISALQFNENYVDLVITPPSDKNSNCTITPNVNSSYFNIIDSTVVTDAGYGYLNVSRAYGTNDILISGRVKKNSSKIYRSPSIENPTKFYVTVLKEVLESEGIKVIGNAVDCDEINNWNHNADDFISIDTLYSPPLKDILKGLMKRSQNLYAETMVKTLGSKYFGRGSFSNGKKVVEEVLSGMGIKPNTYSYMDGSGLSRYNFVTPLQLVTILEAMRKSNLSNDWYDLFPIAGVDGTLSARMKNGKARNNVRAKTGTIANTRGLSGYVTTASGDEIVFSFLINAHLQSTKATEELTDTILELLAEYDKKLN